MIEPIFNDLCIPASSQQEAGILLCQLIDVLLAADKTLIKDGLTVPMDFYQLGLAENYSINDWLNDSAVSKDLKGFFFKNGYKSSLG